MMLLTGKWLLELLPDAIEPLHSETAAVSVAGFSAGIAVFFGITALAKTRGTRRARAAWLGFLLGVCLLVSLIPFRRRAVAEARKWHCGSNLRMIGRAIEMYAQDNGG